MTAILTSKAAPVHCLNTATAQDAWAKAALERQYVGFVAAVGMKQYRMADRLARGFVFMAKGRATK